MHTWDRVKQFCTYREGFKKEASISGIKYKINVELHSAFVKGNDIKIYIQGTGASGNNLIHT